MRKQLPKIKKGLKSFILDDDAKVIDKAATKIALTSSFMAFSLIASSNNANAWLHNNHSNHSNNLNSGYSDTGVHSGNNPMSTEVNGIYEKDVLTAHSNHYNHSDGGYDLFKPDTWFGGGGASWIGGIIATVGFGGTGGIIEQAIIIDTLYEPEAHEVIDTGTPYIIPDEILIELDEE